MVRVKEVVMRMVIEELTTASVVEAAERFGVRRQMPL